MKPNHLKTIALSILVASNVFAATNTLHDKTEKTSPSVNDETYIWDVADSTLKKSTTGNLPISTATKTALNGKANSSAFASQAAFTAAWGWTPGSSMTWPASDSAYYAARNGAWASLAGIFAPVLGSDDNYVTDAEKVKLGNLSGTNTGDQDLSGFLSKTNTTAFTPTGDWHPATKKYVDDSITAGGGYTDEQAQDAVGAMLSGNAETGISVTYDDATGKINFDVTATSLPTWMPSVGPTNGRQILQAAGGCSLSAYDNQADCETNSGTWTTPTYQHTSIISGLINDTGTADDDLWSAAKIAGDLAGKQATLGFTPENAAQKGAANGYAGLDSNGKVPTAQLPTLGTTYDLPSLADAQAGTSTTPYVWSPQRVAQAIVALAPSGEAASITTSPPYTDVQCVGNQYDTSTDRLYLCIGGYYVAYLQSITFSNPSPDLTPDAFSFSDVTDAELSTQYTALAQITGITGDITCSGSGGTVAACTGSTEGTCGTFGATSGSITNNQYVGVRQTSSASNSTATNATATCGGVSDTFTVTTANSVASCSTQSVLLPQTGSFVYNEEVYGSSGVAARITGNGKALYSVKAKTGSIVGGTPGVWTVYINTSLDFTGAVTDSFAISPPSTTYTEFSAQSTAMPILENGVNYYVGFAKPGSAWGERAVFNVISGVATSPANNYWTGNINGTMTQSTVGSLWLEVKTCD